VLPINQRYFSSKKDKVEIFGVYMQEVNLKVFQFSVYFTYVSVSGPLYKQEISASRFVELCLGVVVSEKSTYFTHTSYFLNTSLETFFFSPLAVHMQHFSCVPVMKKADQTLLSAVPVYRLAPSFPVYLS
jgi:hypothetical protein